MNIHEYQAKQLLAKYGVCVPAGDIAYTTHEAEAVSKWLDEDLMVIKAQIHAGGRGKGGGVKLVHSSREAVEAADAMFGMNLVTEQTGPQGKTVNRVYIEAGVDIGDELYFCIVVDRSTGGNTIIASTQGGMDIEDVSERKPEKIITIKIAPGAALQPHHARKLAYDLGLSGRLGRRAQETFINTYKAFVDLDAAMIEINPLVITTDKKQVIACDCKASFDDNALYRQRQVQEMRDDDESDPLELEAARHDLNYVKLEGNIGIMVNGAGLSMATMDLIEYEGGKAANFMDVAGAATPERVAAAFKLIYRDSDVEGILVNIFGGMMRCNDIAEGLVNAAAEVGLSKPLVVRLEGTNVEIGRDILKKSSFPIEPVESMAEAASKIVQAVKEIN